MIDSCNYSCCARALEEERVREKIPELTLSCDFIGRLSAHLLLSVLSFLELMIIFPPFFFFFQNIIVNKEMNQGYSTSKDSLQFFLLKHRRRGSSCPMNFICLHLSFSPKTIYWRFDNGQNCEEHDDLL